MNGVADDPSAHGRQNELVFRSTRRALVPNGNFPDPDFWPIMMPCFRSGANCCVLAAGTALSEWLVILPERAPDAQINETTNRQQSLASARRRGFVRLKE